MDDGKTSPDSWGRLEEDVQRVAKTDNICAYFEHANKSCYGRPALSSPKLCEAVALGDAPRRAKALAGVRNG